MHRPLVAFRHNCQGRSLFLTKEGVPGLGPLAAKEGDIVTVLLGSMSAMILRPTQEGNYKLVGEAYCDGFMHGEALLGPLPDSFNAVLRHNPTNGTFRRAYLDQETGVFQAEDPRLGPLPDGWSIMSHKNEHYKQLFVNDQTGVTRVKHGMIRDSVGRRWKSEEFHFRYLVLFRFTLCSRAGGEIW